MSFEEDMAWSIKIGKIAMEQFYTKQWPGCKVIDLDTDKRNQLAGALDIGGADKMLCFPTGGIAFLSQRFRRWKAHRYDDFTLRLSRPSGKMTEFGKAIDALTKSGFVASYYAYGHVNQTEESFIRFRIILFREFLEACLMGEITASGIKINPNGSSTFYIFPFQNIPQKLLLVDYHEEGF